MNQEERDWLEWLKRAQDGVVTQRQAAEKMGVSDRWVRKLLVRMKTDGDGVVVHGLRGRTSNRQIDKQTQARAMELLKQAEWHDFGPTFASEQLGKRHGIEVSKETVRANWARRISGERDGAGTASWCSGTHRITIGWKAEARRYGT
jgi:hypothetical protein